LAPKQEMAKLKQEIKVTPEGLRIELLESATGTFFNIGSSEPNGNGKELLLLLAKQLGKLPNKISIEATPIQSPSQDISITAIGSFRLIELNPPEG